MRKNLVSGYRSAVAVTAVGLLLFAGCSSDSDEPEGTDTRDVEKSSVEEDVDELSKDDIRALEAAVGKAKLNEGDVGHDVSVEDTSEGTDAPTNDICGENWATNSLRVARQQDYFWKSDEAPAQLVVSNEVVAYQPGTATDVLNEIEQSVADCDGWEHAKGEMSDVESVDPPGDALDNARSWEATDDREEDAYSYVAVYQTKGDLMSALYVWATDGDQAREVADELTPEVAKKLESAQN